MFASPAIERKLLPLTVVGSYPPPLWFRQVLQDRAQGRISQGQAEEAARDATLAVIHEQHRMGIDLPTGGEMGRLLPVHDADLALEDTVGFLWGGLSRLKGVAYEREAGGGRFRVVGPLSAPLGLGAVEEFQIARELVSFPLKATVPGPFSIALMLVDPAKPDSLQAVLSELLPILRQELEDLAHAGAGDIQIDEPSLGVLLGGNPQHWVAAFNELVADLPVRIQLHICLRDLRQRTRAVPRTYRPLMPYLNDLRVQGIHLEYSLNNMRELELLGEIGYDKQLAIGVIAAHSSDVEPPRMVADRVRAILRYVDVPRLTLAPDCGLSSLSREVARRKILALSQGASLVRRELNRGRR